MDWHKVITRDEKFIIEQEDFVDLEIQSTDKIADFYYFFNKKTNRLIKEFILKSGERVDYICCVTLIKKDGKFTPRLAFSVRDKTRKIQVQKVEEESTTLPITIKASVDLDGCNENFWKLISFLQSLRDMEIPKGKFALISQEENDIVEALKERDIPSILSIIRKLSTTEGLQLSEVDVNQLLRRREKLNEFREALTVHGTDESWWQNFFEENKWIFGYGLNYQILHQEQDQPHFGGVRVDGTGGQKGDYLTSTLGDLSFTVLVEIKTPETKLLQGTSEIRNGAWSYSKDLTDALSQISSNIDTWNKYGSTQLDNIDRFEDDDIYTVQPKGIIVIGSLAQLGDMRSKRETFQRFRKSIHGIDILTFDELFERAKFIVEESDNTNKEPDTNEVEIDPEKIPF